MLHKCDVLGAELTTILLKQKQKMGRMKGLKDEREERNDDGSEREEGDNNL